jgi:hypothetical protein
MDGQMPRMDSLESTRQARNPRSTVSIVFEEKASRIRLPGGEDLPKEIFGIYLEDTPQQREVLKETGREKILRESTDRHIPSMVQPIMREQFSCMGLALKWKRQR